MLEEGKPDLEVAFPGGRGTANMARQAREAGVQISDSRQHLPLKYLTPADIVPNDLA